ncbi:putative axonemal 84 kDa protein-like isoform X1 [Apostichopus japonicus]|uniref:Putative axonemal 84 kDa protein-like isoform X1 n=1 Tax=Stichopus japonicus TaxID=307972 RepID=A0A2G8L0I2_STIJA|nr:putative axonemal 84 kDa protein-like isoform X1 [Apostichopus japonicus]
MDADCMSIGSKPGATYQADSESGNLQLVNGNECMLFMVWGTSPKIPESNTFFVKVFTALRFKSYEFEKSKLSFELPKQLALSDVAVRFIQTKYDHYSHRCRTFSLKKKKKKTSVLEVVELPEEEKQNGEEPKGGEAGEAVEEDKKEVEGDAKETEEKKDEDTAEVVGEAAGENDEKTDEKQGSAEAAGATEGEAAEGGGDEDGDEDDDDEMNEFEDEDTVDLRAYQVLGGVLNFDLLALPPQPKQVKGWIMTQVTSSELQRVPYPAINDAPKLGQTLSGTITMGQTLDPKAVANAAAAAEALGASSLA